MGTCDEPKGGHCKSSIECGLVAGEFFSVLLSAATAPFSKAVNP